MRRNVRPDITVMIARKSVVATIIHRAMHKVVFAYATKAGPVRIVHNRAQKASTVSDAKRNVQPLFLAIKHAITSPVNTYAVPATLA